MNGGRALGMVAATFALCGCASLGLSSGCARGEQRLVADTLYFGTQVPGGGVVSSEQWAEFVDKAIAPRLPRGSTVWPASGQWRAADGRLVREWTYVLRLVHANDDPGNEAVRQVMQDYKTQFRQEAVMRVRAPVCVSF